MESSNAEGVKPEQRRSHGPQGRAGSLLPGSLPGTDGLLKVHVPAVQDRYSSEIKIYALSLPCGCLLVLAELVLPSNLSIRAA